MINKQAFNQIFGGIDPPKNNIRNTVCTLYFTSYATQRDLGMPADKAAALLGVDAEIAEKLYQDSKQ